MRIDETNMVNQMNAKSSRELAEKHLTEIGRDESAIVPASPEVEEAIDQGLGMKLISIRLPGTLIEELKVIAEYKQLGYQPLVREVLGKYADEELKRIGLELCRVNKTKS